VVVGLAVERSVEMLVALLGILKSGAAYVPLDSSFPAERLRFLIEDSGASGVVSSFEGSEAEDLRAQLKAVVPEGTPILLLEDMAGPDAGPVPDGAWKVPPGDLAYILYTSGSTGRPKGVEVTHASVVNFMESMAVEPGLTARDALLAVTTLSFDIALLELVLPLVVGGRTLVASRATASDGEKLKVALVRSGATAMQATPATWRMLLEAGFRPGRNLKVLCGGEALPAALAAELLTSAPEIWNLYGPTETTIWSTVARLTPGRAPVLGKPIANTQIYILDPLLQLVPDGVPGEICIGGDGVARGYHGRPDLTAERFLPDPFASAPARLYRTGDVGLMRPDGSLHYLGRGDDQLKIRGFRIEPAEIEAALARHPGVQQVAVVADRRAAEDVRLIAYVRCEEQAFSPDAFRRFLAGGLPAYMIPSSFVRLDQLPLTPNGKVDRVALASREAPALDATPAEWVAPRTPVEERLAAIWRDIIRIDRVGVRDSFFDLGGHSLLAARVIARVQESFGVRLPITLFYARATIEEHARYVEQSLPMTDQRLEDLMNWIEGLSDEEAARYLEQRQGKSQGAHS
jgi:amino acid adenylation domain-containing protein